jgi:hypothetical protein
MQCDGDSTLYYRQGQIYPLYVFKLGPGRSEGTEGSMEGRRGREANNPGVTGRERVWSNRTAD